MKKPGALYERMVKSSELMFGKVPDREQLLHALGETIDEEDLRIYFLLKFGSSTPLEKIRSKARRLGYTSESLDAALERLYRQAFVLRHEKDGQLEFEQCPLSMIAEQQVRIHRKAPLGKAYADYWLNLATVSAYNLPTKTPYFRVMAVEETIRPPEGDGVEIQVDYEIPDQREVLPLDVVSDVVRSQKLIGVADCYCRLSREFQGQDCEKPRETCFVFNEFGQSLINLGIARKLELDEALAILRDCEKQGLVHNADNFQGQIRGLCNCCSCCCPGMIATAKGMKNIEAVSRYDVANEPAKCISDFACVSICPVHAITEADGDGITIDHELCFGCGLCVSVCPEAALKMVVREHQPKLPKSAQAMQNALMSEVILGTIVNKVTGKARKN